jgi:hypothetical protein
MMRLIAALVAVPLLCTLIGASAQSPPPAKKAAPAKTPAVAPPPERYEPPTCAGQIRAHERTMGEWVRELTVDVNQAKQAAVARKLTDDLASEMEVAQPALNRESDCQRMLRRVESVRARIGASFKPARK